ncbi:MAG: hypothetical protein R3D33_09290 [Hyphomicrobiaceae bacterium]
MFQSILNRAERKIDSALTHLMLRIAMTVPIIVGVGFALAAICGWLAREFGWIYGSLILGGVLMLCGLIGHMIVARQPTGEPGSATIEEEGATASEMASGLISPDMIASAVASLGPVLGPVVARSLLRNLPLVIVVIAIGYFISQSPLTRGKDAEPDAFAEGMDLG